MHAIFAFFSPGGGSVSFYCECDGVCDVATLDGSLESDNNRSRLDDVR